MADDRRRIGWSIWKAAKALPRGDRQALYRFLCSLPGGEPKRRKHHSWRGKKMKTRSEPRKRKERKQETAQMSLPLHLEESHKM